MTAATTSPSTSPSTSPTTRSAAPGPDPVVAAPAEAVGGPERRLDQLARRAAALRLARGRRQSDDRWLLLVGGVALPVGLVLILLGWYGSAQTALPFEQTPYLISGGILGLAVVVGGGFLYFSYWLTRLVREGREERVRLMAHQERLERTLELLAEHLQAPARPARGTRTTAAGSRASGLVVTTAGSMVHRPDCIATAGQEVAPADLSRTDLTACGLCRPEMPAAPARARSRSTRS